MKKKNGITNARRILQRNYGTYHLWLIYQHMGSYSTFYREHVRSARSWLRGQKKTLPEKLFGVKEDLGAGFSFSSFFSSFFSFSFSFLSLLSGTSFFQDLIKLFAIVIISSSLLAFLSGTKTNNVKLPQILLTFCVSNLAYSDIPHSQIN
jgi:hypothetical protein